MYNNKIKVFSSVNDIKGYTLASYDLVPYFATHCTCTSILNDVDDALMGGKVYQCLRLRFLVFTVLATLEAWSTLLHREVPVH